MLKVGQQYCDNISLNITLFLAWLHNRFPVFLPVVMPVRGAFTCWHVGVLAFPESVRPVMGSICRNGQVLVVGQFPQFTQYTQYTVHPTIHRGLGVQYSTVQYSTVQYSTVQYSTVQYSTVQYSTVQYSTVQYSTVQYSTVQYSTVQYSTVQYSTVQYSTVQYSTVQYSTVQYSTVQYSTECRMYTKKWM